MSATEELTGSAAEQALQGMLPSPAGPAPQGRPLALPPLLKMPRALQQLRFGMRQAPFLLSAQRALGQTFRMSGVLRDDWATVTSHPHHVRSLFTEPQLTPSLTGESPLRPIVGPNSVLTLLGERHLRQRRLLLPPFHGEAIERYVAMISAAAEREIDRWPVGEPFALAPKMQAITLDVIMAGIFGVEGLPAPGTLERELRDEIRRIVGLSTRPFSMLAELVLMRRQQPGRVVGGVMETVDGLLYALIAQRRKAHDVAERECAQTGRPSDDQAVPPRDDQRGRPSDDRPKDILSLLLSAVDEDGKQIDDEELRDELITLVLAGHETTANSLAWAFERLLRHRSAYDRLRDLTRDERASDEADAYVEACIHEAMRVRPVIPSIGRRVTVPWQLGQFVVPAGSGIVVSIVLLHHRQDVYPRPFAFCPERFLGVKPGTYTWIPFGGGIRRCLGATLAIAEQQVVMRAIARRTDMIAPHPQPEQMRHRNVTMVPAKGTVVKLTRRF